QRARVGAAVAAGRARELSARSISWAAPPGGGVAGALVQGTLLRLYRFDRFKGDKSEDTTVESLEVVADSDASAEVDAARVRAEAQNAARDLQNLPPNVATPAYLGEQATAIAERHAEGSSQALRRAQLAARGTG